MRCNTLSDEVTNKYLGLCEDYPTLDKHSKPIVLSLSLSLSSLSLSLSLSLLSLSSLSETSITEANGRKGSAS